MGRKALRKKVNFWNVWLLNVFLNVVGGSLDYGCFVERFV